MNNFSRFFCQSAVIFISLFGLWGCDKLNSPKTTQRLLVPTETTNRTELHRGVIGSLVLNPTQAKNDEQTQLLRDLFEGLTAYDPQGNVIPAAAESWQTQDNKIWHFTLRENLKWSNGEPLTANDFVKSWQALSQSESPLKNYLAFMNVQQANAVLEKKQPATQLGIEAENDRTLRITLDKATPYLPAMLAHISLFPQYSNGSESVVSNGAYQLHQIAQDQLILTVNPHYWAKEKVAFQKVIYQKITPQTLLEKLDVIFNPPASVTNVQEFPQLCGYFYEFNLADPMLKKSAVRKAIVSMISVKNLVDGLPHVIPRGHFLPKSLQGEQEWPWEPAVAEQLLAQNQISETQPLKLHIRYDNAPFHQTIATRLNRQLSQSDLLRVETESMNWADLQTARNQGNFQLIRSGWCGDFNDPAAFLNLFYSKSLDNKNGYKDAEFDRLFEEAMNSPSEKVRQEIYTKLIQQVQQANLVLPIFQYSTPVYLAPSLMGASANPINALYSKDLWRKVNGQQ